MVLVFRRGHVCRPVLPSFVFVCHSISLQSFKRLVAQKFKSHHTEVFSFVFPSGFVSMEPFNRVWRFVWTVLRVAFSNTVSTYPKRFCQPAPRNRSHQICRRHLFLLCLNSSGIFFSENIFNVVYGKLFVTSSALDKISLIMIRFSFPDLCFFGVAFLVLWLSADVGCRAPFQCLGNTWRRGHVGSRKSIITLYR